MSRLVEIPLQDGTTIVAEGADTRFGEAVRSARPADSVTTAATTLEAAVDRIVPASQAIITRLRAGIDAPSEIVLEFGMQVRAEAGLIVARTSGEANFAVRVTWERRD